MKETTMLRVLLVEDNDQDASAIRMSGAGQNIKIKHIATWNQAKEELENNFSAYDGIVLDYRGQIDQDETEDDPRHLSSAIRDLEVIKTKRGYLPYVVHTGFRKEAEKHVRLDCPVFSKSNHEEMLRGLRKLIEESPRSKLKHAYPTVLEFAHQYFRNNDVELLYSVVKKITSEESLPKLTSFVNKKEFMDKLRNLNEALIDTLLKYYPEKHEIRSYKQKIEKDTEENPDKFQHLGKVSAGNRSATFAEYFFIQTGRIPDHIKYTFQSIYYTASKLTAHSNEENHRLLPKEMIQGLAYCHLGCYEWFNELLKDRPHAHPRT